MEQKNNFGEQNFVELYEASSTGEIRVLTFVMIMLKQILIILWEG
jgi:hypothetical protein